LDENLFDMVVALSPHDPEAVSFVRRFLRWAEEQRKYVRNQGPPPGECAPVVSPRSKDDIQREMLEIETSYERVYYALHPPLKDEWHPKPTDR
jgi:hypothetical protein